MRPKRLPQAVAYREAVGVSQRRDLPDVHARQSDAIYLPFTMRDLLSSSANHATWFP
jgi:hypothetical protein